MNKRAHALIANIVLWCTILSLRTLKSFCLIIFYQQNFCIYYFEVAPKPKCVRETLMLMFLSRRRLLIKRLWSLRVLQQDEAPCEAEDLLEGSVAVRTGLLKRLGEHQLDLLIQAVKNRGADLSACILLPQDEMQPHVLSCRVWRWPGLREAAQMRRLPGCRSAKDPVYICCNPYHWSRLCEPESPPPPYCRFPSECFKPEDWAPSEGICDPLRGEQPCPGSLTTNGDGESGPEWCRLAYWEMSTRVGRQYCVVPTSVNVFTCLPHGDGLCLETLAQTAPWPPPEPVLRTRNKIGLGVTLSLEPDGVWVYNRSESPIFVNSPTLDDPAGRSLLVNKVHPGYCMNIFDRTRTPTRSRFTPVYTPIGPVDPLSVRISFAKGWGPKYTRQDVTSCPCWLEVLLKHPCR